MLKSTKDYGNGVQEYYDPFEVIDIANLIGDIRYTHGFLEAVRWEDNLRKSNLELAKQYSIKGFELIKQYNELPKELHSIDSTVSGLEVICQRFLKK